MFLFFLACKQALLGVGGGRGKRACPQAIFFYIQFTYYCVGCKTIDENSQCVPDKTGRILVSSFFLYFYPEALRGADDHITFFVITQTALLYL